MSAKNGNGKAKPKAKNKGGRPTKATHERLAAILHDLTLGMTEEQACAGNGVHSSTFIDWKNKPEFSDLRSKAQYARLKVLLAKQETDPDWKRWQWQLERIFKDQYADPAKVALQFNQKVNNNNTLDWRITSQAELEEVRRGLDEVKLMQERRAAGVATNTELREYLERTQRLLDRLDNGDTLDQKTLDKSLEGTSGRRPVIEIDSQLDHTPLAIEAPPEHPEREPRRVAQRSMRASDMDPSSRVGKPPEPEPVRQTPPRAVSERQRLLDQQRRMGRNDGDGKGIFG